MVDFDESKRLKSLPRKYMSKQAEAIANYEKQGIDIINLGRGNPDLPTPQHIVDRLKEAVDVQSNHGYPPYNGKKSLKQAIVAFYKREYDVDLDPDTEIAIFNGSIIAVAALPQCLLNPGDTIMFPEPAFPMYYSAVKLAEAHLYGLPVKEEDGFLPDYNAIPTQIANRTKLLLLNYPNNPTGAVATSHFFAETVQFATKHNIPVFHDMAYGSIGFDGHKPLSFLQTKGAKEIGVEVYTMSKAYNMAGWRVAFAVGNPSIIAGINRFVEHAYGNVFGAVQDAAAAALTSDQDCVRQITDIYNQRRDTLVNGLNKIGWHVRPSAGTFFVWAKVPEGYSSEQFSALLLDKAHVAVIPGEAFGQHGAGYVRISLVSSEERLLEAVQRIKDANILRYQKV
ncbi:aminotransferase class I/II-fold pyridoxal phosphate-dependent enzyme [Paenibacillus kribbensis]|uniref:aminotransferase class I/II-fold pyridoxal phosphate-dependent enzyme n=1 Tax=Paenibacillus kribbensis TaxID=172713 RepID=UPI0008390012|nr:aminotransferase class I/II-fold pyridoxal phosphate-dependent enzyme [Paenibacillus kribbensis]